jgi:hypothetical protein
LFTVYTDQTDRADADLFIHSRAAVGRRFTVEVSDIESPVWNRDAAA